ncbi:MAG: response regulator transcription factor, partial [Ktedonobacteraceae bacterium]|nr:response regulator transcription factor [Ktedonobacteraceae bacterium]
SISAGTVRAHLSAIYSKLAVHSRTAAIHAARGHGIL